MSEPPPAKGKKRKPANQGDATTSKRTTADDASATGAGAGGTADSLPEIDAFFVGIDGYQLSRDEKLKQREAGVFNDGLQYGEVNTADFVRVLTQLSDEHADGDGFRERVFVDVGSGTGKAVLAAACKFDFASVHGLEILEDLHKASNTALQAFRSKFPDNTKKVEFVCTDAFAYDWSNFQCDELQSVVFATTTCFTDVMLQQLECKVASLPKGSFVIITTSADDFGNKDFQLVQKGRLRLTKGSLQYFCFRKK